MRHFSLKTMNSAFCLGTSVKNMVHWAQELRKDRYGKYDYGCGVIECENEIHYGQKTPYAQ